MNGLPTSSYVILKTSNNFKVELLLTYIIQLKTFKYRWIVNNRPHLRVWIDKYLQFENETCLYV